MNKEFTNYYKTCRETAGLTQETAAEALAVSSRTLSDYENGKAKVPDDIVDSMAVLYKSPLLAWWHLKNTSVLGKYLPDVAIPKTEVDMVFQGILAKDKLSPIVDALKEIMSDGVIDKMEEQELDKHMEDMKIVNNKLTSIIVWNEERTKKESRPKLND